MALPSCVFRPIYDVIFDQLIDLGLTKEEAHHHAVLWLVRMRNGR